MDINLLKENGCCMIDGREYIMTEPANFQSDPINCLDGWVLDNYYSVRAICADDERDEDGYQKCYTIRWDILESYDPECEGDDCACDWDNPTAVKECGEYSLDTGCYY